MAKEWLTPEAAAQILASPVKNAETWHPRVRAGRFLMPVVRPAELVALKMWNAEPKAPTFTCRECGRFAFSEPATCWWCRRGRA